MDSKKILEKNFELVPGHNKVLEIKDANRYDLAKFLADIGSNKGVEVGVAHGKFSEIMMDYNPTLELYGVDSYRPYKGYKDYQLERTFATLRADAHVRLDRYPNYHFVEKFSMDAVKDFEDNSLDFVYLDANHSDPYVTQDIREWTPKVKPGGVVSGHDYARVRGREHESAHRYDVIEAIDSYTQQHGIQLYIWGLNSKEDPALKRDSTRSWMFFR